MTKELLFTGAGTALITPFTPCGEIYWEELERLVEFQIENGIDSIIACGTTGEAATMSAEEHLQTVNFIIEKVKGRALAAMTPNSAWSFPWKPKSWGPTACCW